MLHHRSNFEKRASSTVAFMTSFAIHVVALIAVASIAFRIGKDSHGVMLDADLGNAAEVGFDQIDIAAVVSPVEPPEHTPPQPVTAPTLAKLDVPGAGLLVQMLELLQAHPHLNTAALLEHWRESQEGKYLAKLAQWQPEVPEGVEAKLQGALQRLAGQYHEQRVEDLLHQERLEGLNDTEKAELRRLLSLSAGKKAGG